LETPGGIDPDGLVDEVRIFKPGDGAAPDIEVENILSIIGGSVAPG